MKGKQKHDYDEYLEDVELWESKKLGASPKFAKRISRAEEKAIDDSLGLQAITMRLQKELVRQLKNLARQEGLGYQPYIRQILTRHVKAIKLVNQKVSKRKKAG